MRQEDLVLVALVCLGAGVAIGGALSTDPAELDKCRADHTEALHELAVAKYPEIRDWTAEFVVMPDGGHARCYPPGIGPGSWSQICTRTTME